MRNEKNQEKREINGINICYTLVKLYQYVYNLTNHLFNVNKGFMNNLWDLILVLIGTGISIK